ncbi:efflux RND transporter periplasmic adaptor subunit [candidate division KSB1 bacterium]|nr:efflux RND transporter periplasmic adaptor subunit [candidate division KSB1 bacterium]
MKRFVIAALVIVAAVAAYFVWGRSDSAGSQRGKYRLGTVDRGKVQMVVTASGTVSAVTTVTVGSQVSGTLDEILVDFNSPVKKGQVIARIDPTFLQAQVTENEANLERANATLRQAQRDLRRVADLAEKQLAAQVDLDNAQTALETAQAGVKQVEAQVQRTRVNLAYSVIRSPIDGVVISRSVDVGQTVAASLQAPTLFTIAQDLKQMQIETSIDEADIGKLEEGMDATFTVDSYPELTFRAKISQIRYAAVEEQNVVTYPVILKVDNPELKLRPGMTANVTVVVSQRDDALRAPAAAVRFKPADYKPNAGGGTADSARGGHRGDGDFKGRRERAKPDATVAPGAPAESPAKQATLFVKNAKGEPEPRRVQIGLNDGSYVELLDQNLSAGDSVIVGLTGTTTQAVTMMPGMGPSGPRR